MKPANVLFAMAPGASLSSDARVEELLGSYMVPQADSGNEARRPYLMLTDGVAAIPFLGCLSKYPSILRILGFSDKPTLPELTAAVLAAGAAEEVRGLLLLFDSPGGTAAGTPEAAAAVASVAGRKPVHAYASDDCCSGALWIASQCNRLTTNSIGHVGSIGCYSVLEDSSEAAALEGLRFVVVGTGGVKGQGEDGVPLSDEYIGEIQGRVDAINAEFVAGLAEGLGLSLDAVKAMANGHVYIGKQAVEAGLVDGVESLSEALDSLRAAMVLAAAPPVEVLPTDVAPTDRFEEEDAESTREKNMSKPNAETPPASGNVAEEDRGALQRLREAFASLMGGGAVAQVETPPPAPAGLTAADVDARVAAGIATALASKEVDADLKALSGKVPPAILDNPKTREHLLSAKAAGPDAYTYQLGLVAATDASSLLGGPIADAAHADDARVATETEAMLERNGIKPERAAELTKRYHFAVN